MTGSDAAADTSAAASDRALAAVFRAEAARVTGILTAATGSLDIAEEATAEAIEEALVAWRRRGVPPRPGAWLLQAARHNALDRLRRQATLRGKLPLLAADATVAAIGDEDAPGPDERLPLLFGCCHPSLAPEAQLALTLRAVLGVTTEQIARATLEPVATVGQRISRAKRKIGASGIPVRVPTGAERAERLDTVLAVVSVMYSSAHLVPGADAAADRDLADDALWLAGVIAHELPDEPEAAGLHSLLLLHRAREGARAVGGDLVPLGEQDRSRWDRHLLTRGHAELERAARRRRPGRWQLHAAIAACHSDAAGGDDTDWLQLLVLYDMLTAYDRSPIVRLNRAVVLAEVAGPGPALAEVDELADRLVDYHLWHAVRAGLLRGIGRDDEADDADRRAWTLTANEAERRLLERRLRLG
ncbi:RNA polymerase sigma factor [Microbacterium telephonicum]|uniref:RNA polymerase ECF family sigma subunit n=1 Tax=Microbacterium telephonicum TaxID=1714841 RepID=A0A498BYX0_9MICO|nr:DUF6596 domain-containing protein [Microbacterium telephonicum]RLK47556.1 RNA polymerase ECF family sigma subunit [Microbacterium telephonicum]